MSGVQGGRALDFFFHIGTALYLDGFSAHGFFADGFLFSVKELGFFD